MKRSSSPISKRKRTNNNGMCGIVPDDSALTEPEIEAIQQAFIDGARGQLVISLQGKKRIMTMLIPPQPNLAAAIQQTERLAQEIRTLGCDGYIFVRRGQLSGHNTKKPPQIVMVIDEHTLASHRQVIRAIQPDALMDEHLPRYVKDMLGSTFARAWNSVSGD